MLQVEPSSDVETIRKSYIKLSVKVHPDRNRAPDATRAFQRVAEAYEVLSDDNKRREYDLTRAPMEDFSFEDAIRVFAAAVRTAQAASAVKSALDGGNEDLPAYLHLASALLSFRSSNSGLAEAALLAAAGTSAAISMIPDSWKDNIRKHATPENAIRAVGTAAVIAGALLSATRNADTTSQL